METPVTILRSTKDIKDELRGRRKSKVDKMYIDKQ